MDDEHDAGRVHLRRCSHHVYEDVIHFSDDTSHPLARPHVDESHPSARSHVDENKRSSPTRDSDIVSPTPSRLGWILVNQFLPPATLRKRRNSCPAPTGRNTTSPNPKPKTPSAAAALDDNHRSFKPPPEADSPASIDESGSRNEPQVEEESTSSNHRQSDEGTNPATIDESSSGYAPPPQVVEESKTSNPPEIDQSRIFRPASIDESRLYSAPQVEEERISSSSSPRKTDEDNPNDGAAGPPSIDETRSWNVSPQERPETPSERAEIDESEYARPAALMDDQMVSYDARPSHPPPQDEEEKERPSTTGSPPRTNERKGTRAAPSGAMSRPFDNQQEATPSSVAEEARDHSRSSAGGRLRRHRRGRSRGHDHDHFVRGYVVRDRNANRRVPVLNTDSSKDDDVAQIRPDFDILDEVGEVGQGRDMFWPQPGDILVLQSHRAGIPYPGFDGHVELYVDEFYFENPDYTWDWAYDFQEGDILIRFGRFSPRWKWSPEDSVQVYLRFGDCFMLVGREVNQELSPLDFKFYNPTLRRIHSVQADFHPRLGDLIVRKDSATRPFNWTLIWWKEAFYVPQPFDMLVRAGFVNSDDHIHSFGEAEVYFRNAQNQLWSFQGRDDYSFGGGP